MSSFRACPHPHHACRFLLPLFLAFHRLKTFIPHRYGQPCCPPNSSGHDPDWRSDAPLPGLPLDSDCPAKQAPAVLSPKTRTRDTGETFPQERVVVIPTFPHFPSDTFWVTPGFPCVSRFSRFSIGFPPREALVQRGPRGCKGVRRWPVTTHYKHIKC